MGDTVIVRYFREDWYGVQNDHKAVVIDFGKSRPMHDLFKLRELRLNL